MANYHFLHDVELKRNPAAYANMLNNPMLSAKLAMKAVELMILYQASVGKKTGKLQASADVDVRVGGKKNDRQIGVVTIADDSVVDEWKGKPFYYGVYHEAGTTNSKRAKRRKSSGPRGPRKGYNELREAAQMWRASP